MTILQLKLAVEVVAVEMDGCSHTVYLTTDHQRQLRNSHKSFFCTVCGRNNYYPGKSDEERLREQLEAEQRGKCLALEQRDRAENRRRAEKAAKMRIKNRIAKGVCPCCNRTFQDLQRHMANKHPDYTELET